jgi:hypothetical protein
VPNLKCFENEDSEEEGIFIPLRTVATPLTDPFGVPEVQRLINRRKCPRESQKKASISRVTRRRKEQNQKQHANMSRGQRSSPLNLPVDIRELILDELSANASLSYTANAADAFYWHLPDKSWRKRLPLDMLVELDGILNDADFDWRRFFIEFSRLAARGFWRWATGSELLPS